MREMGVHGLLIYCADYRCSHCAAISADHWPDDLRLSDIEPRFTCTACGKRGADVRPDFNWNKVPVNAMGYR
jgi:DNA-directed RNA polymerase subunit RPC12/RpoP